MQKIIHVSNDEVGRVQHYLNEGWKVVNMIAWKNNSENDSYSYGCYVIIEKEDNKNKSEKFSY